jgi:hypothetical protein
MAYHAVNLLKRTSKVLGVCVLMYFAFFVYAYFFSPLFPDGKVQQKEAFSAEARTVLLSYHKQQSEYFSAHHSFRLDLHKREDFREGRNFKYGFANEVPEIAKHCPDCRLTESSFKIGAFGVYKGQDVVWVMDDEGRLVNVSGATN